MAVGSGNLPELLTSFVGRGSELDYVTNELGRSRLLTLTGSGGVGKTRLAIEGAARLQDRYTGGVWLVELAALADPSLVVQAIATTFGLREAGARPILEVLVDALPRQPVLLVLDNCEHLLDACAAACESLLRVSPQLRILLTSREPLGVQGEVVWRVPSLPIVEDGLHEADAMRLFVERARAVRQGFVVSDGNAAATVEICRRLDGIPLAIELAAAWVNTLSVQEIAARLVDRFDLVAGGRRAALPRQQTLRDTLDWSYGLLTDAQRLALRRLAVFEGGWTLEAAEAICSADAIQAEDVLGLLAALVSKSLVLADPESVPARYRLLETTRQYALELLDGSDAGETRRRHADYFRWLAHRAQPGLLGPRLAEWIRRLDPEVDNIRAALRWAAEHAEADAELDIVASLWDYWWMRGRLSEGQRHLEAALTRYPVQPSEMHCRATHGAGLLAAIQGDLGGRAVQRFGEAVDLYRLAGDRAGMIRPLSDLASTLAFLGDNERGEQCAAEALRVARAESDQWGLAYAIHMMGQLRLSQNRNLEAVRFSEDEVELWRAIGDARGLAHGLLQLAIGSRRLAMPARALDQACEALELFGALGETWGELGSIISIATAAVALGEVETAGRIVAAADELSRITGAVPIPTWQVELDYARSGAAAVASGATLKRVLEDGRAIAARYGGGSSSPPEAPGGLTRREFEVLDLVARRYSNREIAETLVLSVRTVERHITNIYTKTGVTNRREAEAYLRKARA